MHIFYLGAPGPAGGANTECLHTFAIWRKYLDLEITVIPTWAIGDEMRRQLESMGCKVVATTPATIHSVPGISGGIVHSFCNGQLWIVYPVLKQLGCKVSLSNCMTFCFPEEEAITRKYGPCSAYHFQSQFQKRELEAKLSPLGYKPETGHLIPGAFDFDLLPFNPRPHAPGEEFTIGRLARADIDKWSSNHWNILNGVPYPKKRAIAMGWTPQIDAKCRNKPAWAETFPVNSMPVKDFLGRCHAMNAINGGARENWPRIGLECMAAGVPIVAQREWGWPEVLGQNSEGGLLSGSDQEMQYLLARLAFDEDFRQQRIHQGRKHVQELCCPERIAKQWLALFEGLS